MLQEVISRKVLVDEGQRQVVEVEQAALWRFFWWSGTISVHVLVDQNREDHSVRITFFSSSDYSMLIYMREPSLKKSDFGFHGAELH
ncbi:hypothetical protein GQ457_16G013220 [Hibiscus cannabinus]